MQVQVLPVLVNRSAFQVCCICRSKPHVASDSHGHARCISDMDALLNLHGSGGCEIVSGSLPLERLKTAHAACIGVVDNPRPFLASPLRVTHRRLRTDTSTTSATRAVSRHVALYPCFSLRCNHKPLNAIALQLSA